MVGLPNYIKRPMAERAIWKSNENLNIWKYSVTEFHLSWALSSNLLKTLLMKPYISMRLTSTSKEVPFLIKWTIVVPVILYPRLFVDVTKSWDFDIRKKGFSYWLCQSSLHLVALVPVNMKVCFMINLGLSYEG